MGKATSPQGLVGEGRHRKDRLRYVWLAPDKLAISLLGEVRWLANRGGGG